LAFRSGLRIDLREEAGDEWGDIVPVSGTDDSPPPPPPEAPRTQPQVTSGPSSVPRKKLRERAIIDQRPTNAAFLDVNTLRQRLGAGSGSGSGSVQQPSLAVQPQQQPSSFSVPAPGVAQVPVVQLHPGNALLGKRIDRLGNTQLVKAYALLRHPEIEPAIFLASWDQFRAILPGGAYPAKGVNLKGEDSIERVFAEAWRSKFRDPPRPAPVKDLTGSGLTFDPVP